MSHTLAYLGGATIFAWGVAHLIPTRSVMAGFGPLSAENSRILTMEWVAEGLTLCFIGVLAALVARHAGGGGAAVTIVLRSCAGMLVAMAVLSGFTGARTSVLPMKLCPLVKATVAGMFIAATMA